MWVVAFLVMFFGLLAAGMPIFLVLGSCAAVLFYVSDQPLIGVAQKIIDELNSPTLMALPLFVMAAAFMRRRRHTRRPFARVYLANSGRFSERWRNGHWSEFELADADVRAVVASHGKATLRDLTLFRVAGNGA